MRLSVSPGRKLAAKSNDLGHGSDDARRIRDDELRPIHPVPFLALSAGDARGEAGAAATDGARRGAPGMLFTVRSSQAEYNDCVLFTNPLHAAHARERGFTKLLPLRGSSSTFVCAARGPQPDARQPTASSSSRRCRRRRRRRRGVCTMKRFLSSSWREALYRVLRPFKFVVLPAFLATILYTVVIMAAQGTACCPCTS